jgi:phosphate transport system permease protein
MPLLARPWVEVAFRTLALAAIVLAFFVLVVLLERLISDGWEKVNWDFLTSFPSRVPGRAGIAAALAGTVGLLIITIAFALPVGVGAAIYLEEYSRDSRWNRILELCLANLAGVPSILYGLLGLQLFARGLGFGRSILAGGLTLALLVLPIVIIACREAIRNVPRAYRDGAIALGASRWQVTWTQVLPVALPGILTGCILAFSRAVGETAPLVTLGALTYVAFLPDSLLSEFTALPIQTFNWLSRPQSSFHVNAAGAIIVLLIVMVIMNATAIILRAKLERRQK